MTSNRFAWLAIAGLLLVIAVAGVLVAIQPTSEIDPNSPAGVVQKYVAAVMDGDHDRAVEYFSTETTCDAEDLDRTYVDPAARIDLIDTAFEGERARVRISITTPSGDLLQNGRAEDRTIRLTKTDGEWKLTGIPWPLYECGVWLK